MPSVAHFESIDGPSVRYSRCSSCAARLEISASAASEVRETVNLECCRDQPTFGASHNQYLSVLDCRTSHIRKEYVLEDIDP